MQVNIYGLSDTDALEERGQPDGQVWSLNDYYQFHPWLKVDRIFNLHHFPYVHVQDPSRFSGDWKAKYNQSGAIVHTLGNIKGVDNCDPISESALIEYAGGKKYLRCSISTMIYMAAWAKFQWITICGVCLDRTEYHNQIWGIQQAIAKARDEGVKVNVLPLGRETEWKERQERRPFIPDDSDITLTYWECQARRNTLKLKKDQLGEF